MNGDGETVFPGFELQSDTMAEYRRLVAFGLRSRPFDLDALNRGRCAVLAIRASRVG